MAQHRLHGLGELDGDRIARSLSATRIFLVPMKAPVVPLPSRSAIESRYPSKTRRRREKSSTQHDEASKSEPRRKALADDSAPRDGPSRAERQYRYSKRPANDPDRAAGALASAPRAQPAVSSLASASESSSLTARPSSSSRSTLHVPIQISLRFEHACLRIEIGSATGSLDTLRARPSPPSTVKNARDLCRERYGGPRALAASMASYVNEQLLQRRANYLDVEENERIKPLQKHLDDKAISLRIPLVGLPDVILARVTTMNCSSWVLSSEEVKSVVPALPTGGPLPDAALAKRLGADPREVRVSIVNGFR
ncbi:hypothetical protein BDZ90DRAFT_123126 [Jaminaea rosea]|uniref:Uncharacterized protein n=1 Tax=Jaminaea rosea TaxID=1569628 RepID=A0A316UMJ5_9BASI|nr:hypothetical protein BDZ90DRAFT_123126 [Jaminaea rosea]PWN24395.1 hypothetical protein BDZ90DRAFT_123126 [Jaminaea rosea]